MDAKQSKLYTSFFLILLDETCNFAAVKRNEAVEKSLKCLNDKVFGS